MNLRDKMCSLHEEQQTNYGYSNEHGDANKRGRHCRQKSKTKHHHKGYPMYIQSLKLG
jgi:hypothetical protein